MPLNSHRQIEAFLVRLAPRKEQVLRSDKDVERLDHRREASNLNEKCISLKKSRYAIIPNKNDIQI